MLFQKHPALCPLTPPPGSLIDAALRLSLCQPETPRPYVWPPRRAPSRLCSVAAIRRLGGGFVHLEQVRPACLHRPCPAENEHPPRPHQMLLGSSPFSLGCCLWPAAPPCALHSDRKPRGWQPSRLRPWPQGWPDPHCPRRLRGCPCICPCPRCCPRRPLTTPRPRSRLWTLAPCPAPPARPPSQPLPSLRCKDERATCWFRF